MAQPKMGQKVSTLIPSLASAVRNVKKGSNIGYWSVPWVAEDGTEGAHPAHRGMKTGVMILGP